MLFPSCSLVVGLNRYGFRHSPLLRTAIHLLTHYFCWTRNRVTEYFKSTPFRHRLDCRLSWSSLLGILQHCLQPSPVAVFFLVRKWCWVPSSAIQCRFSTLDSSLGVKPRQILSVYSSRVGSIQAATNSLESPEGKMYKVPSPAHECRNSSAKCASSRAQSINSPSRASSWRRLIKGELYIYIKCNII